LRFVSTKLLFREFTGRTCKYPAVPLGFCTVGNFSAARDRFYTRTHTHTHIYILINRTEDKHRRVFLYITRMLYSADIAYIIERSVSRNIHTIHFTTGRTFLNRQKIEILPGKLDVCLFSIHASATHVRTHTHTGIRMLISYIASVNCEICLPRKLSRRIIYTVLPTAVRGWYGFREGR